MDLLNRGFGLCLMLAMCQPVFADTVIDVQARGMKSRLMMNESFARVNNAADGSYLLLDRRTKQSYQVLPSTRQIMPMQGDAKAHSASSIKIDLVPKPKANVKLLGYPTQSYDLYANRKHCGTVMASHDAVNRLKVGNMLNAASVMIDQQMDAMGPYIVVIDTCLQASMRLLSHVDKIGLPLRVYDEKGGLLSDVVNIDTQAQLDKGLLAFPADYQQVDSVKQLSPTQKVLQQVRRTSPQINNAYRRVEQYFSRPPQQY